MKAFSVVILVASLAGVAVAAPANNTCKTYVIVSTRGTGEIQGPSFGFLGMIAKTLAFVPNGTEYDTVYPARDADGSYEQGAADVVRYVKASFAACPKQKYFLLGYSQGATATARALRDLTPTSPEGQAILGVLTIGNPGHKPFQHANVDSKGSKTTDSFYGALYNTVDLVPDVWYGSGKYLDICLYNDVVCMAVASSLPLGFAVHLTYGFDGAVQEQGSNFLTNRLYQAGLIPAFTSFSGFPPPAKPN